MKRLFHLWILKIRKSSAVVFIIFFFFPCLLFAETITLRSGKVIKGKIIERTDDCIKIDFYGVPVVYFKDEILAIQGEQLELFDSPLTRAKKGVEYAIENKFKEAREEFEQAIKLYKFSDGSRRILGILNDLDKNIITSECALHIFKGIKYKVDNNQPQQAIEELQQALKLSPDYAFIHNFLGSCYASNGQYEQAIFHYQKAIELEPQTIVYYIDFSSFYTSLKQYDKAIDYLQQAIKIAPDDNSLYIGLANVYWGWGEHQQAIDYGQRAISLVPDNGTGYLTLCTIYLSLGQYQQALTYGEKAIELEPWNFMNYKAVGRTRYYLGQYKEAIEYFNKVILLAPTYASAYEDVGDGYCALGSYSQARENYITAKQLAEKDRDFSRTSKIDMKLQQMPE